MNSTTQSGPSPAGASNVPPTDVAIGILALLLALAAVVVALAQLHQSRAARLRQSDLESAQIGTELSNTSTQQNPIHDSATSSAGNLSTSVLTYHYSVWAKED